MKVSILVCTYGSEEWLDRGRGSPLESAMQQDPHEAFAWHDSNPDATLAKARNDAAINATGDWYCFLDGDDTLQPGYLAGMYRARTRLQRQGTCSTCEPESALLVPAVQYVHAGVTPGGTGHETTPEIPAWGRPLEDINCAVVGTLIHRSVFRAIGGYRDLPLYEDWDLVLRAVRYGCKLEPVPDAVYRAHVSPDGRNSGPGQLEAYDRIRADLAINEGQPINGPGPLPLGTLGVVPCADCDKEPAVS